MVIEIGGYTVQFTEKVTNILLSYLQKDNAKPEAGGILLGQIKNNNVLINKVSFPSKQDKYSRYSFNRNKKKAQILIDYEFLNSDKKTVYFGEWHTHPEKHPSPSRKDKKMIKSQLTLNKLNEEFILQLILGTEGYYLAFWNLLESKKIEIKSKNLPF